MQTTVESKNLLAKLMAAENIAIEHRQCKTAKFNLKTRTLTCPVWKFMDGNLYDLLLGHEVSHALHTPEQGWHDAITDKGKKARSFKHFLNVIEDARIERFIKNKYPGLRRPMLEGYRTLLAQDVFGLSSVSDYNSLYFIDRVNLATKLGSLVNVKFSPEETALLNEVNKTETWEQVVAIAEKIFQYSKDEQEQGEAKKKEEAQRIRKMMEEIEEQEQSENGDDDGDGNEEDEEYETYEFGEEGEEGEEDGEKGKNGSSDNDEDTEDGEKESEGGKDGEGKSSDDGFVPRSLTDESFRKAEEQLVDALAEDPIYVNIPKPNLKHLITPASRVNEGIGAQYLSTPEMKAWAYEKYQEFKEKNTDYINLLVKEFEMLKAANAYKRLKVSESGDLDANKVAQYKFQDDIFRKMLRVQKGKSHGLVLLLDKSGSMSTNYKGAIEQIVVLSMFCRKVNIPFVAYSFNTCASAQEWDFERTYQISGVRVEKFSTRTRDMKLNTVISFREILNSQMNSSQFTQSVINQLAIGNGMAHRRSTWYTNTMPNEGIPSIEGMGSTPLIEALVILRDVVRNFQRGNRLDIVNAIVVHDGQADSVGRYFKSTPPPNQSDTFIHHHYTEVFDENRTQVVINDPDEKFSLRLNRLYHYALTEGIMKWFQQTTGCGIYGFFITDKSASSVKSALLDMYHNKQGIKFSLNGNDVDKLKLLETLIEEFKEEKFLESYTPGYSRFYLIPSGADLETSNGVVQKTDKAWTKHRLAAAYLKLSKKKTTSRVLVNRFISMIAKHQF